MQNVMALPTGLLFEQLETLIAERTLLAYSDAPAAELKNCQNKIDQAQQELMRRMSW